MLEPADTVVRKLILDIMCNGEAKWKGADSIYPEVKQGIERCRGLEKDGLTELTVDGLVVTSAGMPFLRNICLCFDSHYWKNVPGKQIFSMVA